MSSAVVKAASTVVTGAVGVAAYNGVRKALAKAPLREASVSATALERVWKAQNFSYWATNLMHVRRDENPFEQKRRYGEFAAVTGSVHGSAYFAESYTGWPDA